MPFIGREKETEQIKEALKGGKNVIVSGKYGMGRTSLIKHVAEIMQEQRRFLFLDFSETPGKLCQHLVAKLWPERERSGRNEFSKYRSARFRIVSLQFNDSRRHVLVLDNVAKLSAQKIDFIRYLAWEKRFQFVAIAESFIPKDDFLRLRVRLYPAETIMLQNLDKREVHKFYQLLSEQHRLHWTEGHIKNLAEITGGYPLRMTEVALRQLRAKGVAESRVEVGRSG
jgi:energy-coupling factor transporter ATP-binding protein EcfA2